MTREVCEWCGGDVIVGSVCPWSIECPTCHVKPGVRCKRPSGHAAADMHVGRIREAEESAR